MDKTVCELFAGVGGFRCGLNSIRTVEDAARPEKWETVWFSQWEPADKKTQWAWSCYVDRFGTRLDRKGKDTTNIDVAEVPKEDLPDFNLLVGGFPCQDYSVANSLATSKGIEGKKGVLFWSILDTVREKHPPFILLENVDRLIKSPAKQRGRDFGIILACLRDEGYTVEWRVINAADYGFQQRRRRTFIFAYREDTRYGARMAGAIGYEEAKKGEESRQEMARLLLEDGFFATSFPVGGAEGADGASLRIGVLPRDLVELSDTYRSNFENAGVMKDGVVYTVKTTPRYDGPQITLGQIMETGRVDEQFFIPKERLYYTDPEVTHSDESQNGMLTAKEHKTWQYIKGAKRLPRKAANGHEYIFSEGVVSMIDSYDKPARTMLTSEGSFSRTTHIVRDMETGRIRLLTPIEMERIQGFPSDWTKECLVDGQKVEMPVSRRRFMMGNALVVDLVEQMEGQLSDIFEQE